MSDPAYKVDIAKKGSNEQVHTVMRWDDKQNGGKAVFTVAGAKIPDDVKLTLQCIRQGKYDETPKTLTNAKDLVASLVAVEKAVATYMGREVPANGAASFEGSLPVIEANKLRQQNVNPEPILTACAVETPQTPAGSKPAAKKAKG